jgi:hypothetical protein
VKEFVTAAKDSLGEVDEESKITFMHDGREVTFFEPSTGQQAIMLSMGGRTMDIRAMGTFIQLFFEMCDTETAKYLQSRLLDRNDPFDVGGEGGMMEIFEAITQEWSARPTREPSGSPSPRRATGRASTASTRAKASNSSTSRSRASSAS